VNPYNYVERHTSNDSYNSEDDYNKALVDALLEDDIEVIAITDHYRVSSISSLRNAATEAGIIVLPGFEAVTKDGVHMLCIFDREKTEHELERTIGECGITDDSTHSPVGKLYTEELVEHCRKWHSAVIAAHVASDGGLLHKLSGQTRINAWRSPNLLACALPGPVDDAPEGLRPILKNTNPEYKRDRRIAVLNTNDISDPKDTNRSSTSCWIKMSDVSVEGLRQAFLDPDSRIRLASDPQPTEHAELKWIRWEGGFLDDAMIHFNGNLNVLVGGRGTGKSTIIESLRYVLGAQPIGKEATSAHNDIIKGVLKAGTKISLALYSHTPARREYLVERTVPNPPIVRDEEGNVLDITPNDIVPGIDIFGQHEISELTKPGAERTQLLDRFVESDDSFDQKRLDLKRKLSRSRSQLLEVEKDIKSSEEQLSLLPGLEETQKRFKDAGLESRLKEKSEVVKEERIVTTVRERIDEYAKFADELSEELPIDQSFLSNTALKGLPGGPILARYQPILAAFDTDLVQMEKNLRKRIEKALTEIAAVDKDWNIHKGKVEKKYEKILRELQKTSVDGEEFIKLRKQIERLRPLKEQTNLRNASLKELKSQRQNYLADWEDVKSAEYRRLVKAAKRINKKLDGIVRVTVTASGNREPLVELLKDRVGGKISNTIERLTDKESFSLTELAKACRSGESSLKDQFGLTSIQAKNLVNADSSLYMEIEELSLTPTTAMELNVAASGAAAHWRSLEQLSTGQKATAVLLLLLLESSAPLIVDQPEDDLDNRFITDGVVPKMRDEKRKRQFVFATHNANIPVLGDAELILGLMATGEVGDGKEKLPIELMGSIDSLPVREMVEEILEGGKEAFELRRLKYGF